MAKRQTVFSPDALRARHNQQLIVENAELREENIQLRGALHRMREQRLGAHAANHEEAVTLHELMRDLMQDLYAAQNRASTLQEEILELRKKGE